MSPTTDEELRFVASGLPLVAGIDEAGRGCWAGPVVAAAVILPPDLLADPQALNGVDDSKVLSPLRREAFFEQITTCALGWGVGIVPAHIIDTHGIMEATRAAMQIALLRLPVMPHALLIDAVTLSGWPCPQLALVRGDSRCLSIAAASVIAKVTRDRLMERLDSALPGYGFSTHKGYGTAAHEQALQHRGPSVQHRRTFRPLAQFLTDGVWPIGGRRGSGTIVPHMGEGGYDDC
jgi:ribonuclease HII